MKSRETLAAQFCAGTALACVFASGAHAQTTEGAWDSGDIVVTAQKRSESVQKVPISIAAISGEGLSKKQITNVDSLATNTPGLTFGYYGGNARIAIRGVGFDAVGQGTEGRVAYHVDGVYFSRPSSTSGSFFDVERIEVLRGPQGTLYGRNATGGSINVITRAPTDQVEGYGKLTLGNYATVIAEGAIGGPLSDTVSARVAFMTTNHDGYGRNVVTGNDIDDASNQAVRLSVLFEPTGTFKLDVTGDYARRDDHNNGLHYFGQSNPGVQLVGARLGGVTTTNVRNVASEFDPINRAEFAGARVNAELDLGPATLRSITGYRYSESTNIADLDVSSLRLGRSEFFESSNQITQELQLSGEIGRSKWIVGGYYFNEKIRGGGRIPLNTLAFGGPDSLLQGYEGNARIHTRAYAAFGQVDLGLTDKLTATLGARYSWEKASIDGFIMIDLTRPYSPSNPPIPQTLLLGNKSWNAFTPKAGLQYQITPDVMAYASASKGFKSGGFSTGSPQPPVDPETVWAYEGGVKANLPGGGRVNLSGFYYDYTDMQVTVIQLFALSLENAGSSTLYGGEAEIVLPLSLNFSVDLSGSYLHAEYDIYSSRDPSFPDNPVVNLAGNRLVQAPRFNLLAGAEYQTDIALGSLAFRGEVNWVDKVYFTAFNNEVDAQPRYAKANAYINFTSADKKWVASLFVKNINNKNVRTSGVVTAVNFGFPSVGSLQPPRTFGGSVQFNF